MSIAPWRLLALVGFPAGRPRVDDPLASTARRRLLRQATRTPGLTVLALADKAQVPWGSMHYHLRRLQEAGLLRVEESVDDARARRVYPADAPAPALPAARHPALEGAAHRVAALIAQRPGVGVPDLLDLAERSPRTLQTHLKRLLDAGLIASGSPTRYRDLRPTPRLLALLAQEVAPGRAPRR